MKVAICFFLLYQTSVFAAIGTKDSAKVEQAWRNVLQTDLQPSNAVIFPYAHCFKKASVAHRIPVSLLLAVARGESDFNVRAVSKANAYGIMQIQWPGTAKDLGIHKKSDLFNPCININGGAQYLRYLMDRYAQNPYLALAAYNYGPGRIKTTDTHRTIPKGAQWYARYIHQHLLHVANSKPVPDDNPASKQPYARERKINILVFHQVYRAEAFVAYLKTKQPSLNLSWFRRPFGEFHVVLQYQSDAEKRKGLRTLRKLGFDLS